jgi:GGDEF domain-containing protein
LAVFRDERSGLPTRALLEDRIGQAIALAARSGKDRVGILWIGIDVDRDIPDPLCRLLAERLQEHVRRGDSISCADTLGGAFLISLPALPYGNDAALVAQKLLEGLKSPFLFEGRAIVVTASIGISLYPIDARSVAELIDVAASAMQYNRDRGGGYHFATSAESVNLEFRWPTGWAAR